MIAGVALAVQSRINAELGVRLDDGIAAATVSFGSGLLILAPLATGAPAGRRGLRALRAALRSGSLRPWQCLGGVCGAFLVAAQGLAVPSLGVAVFMVALVSGQSASSLAVDHAGLGPAGPHAITARRLAGAALAVLAVLLAVGDRLGNPHALALAALPVLAGAGVAWQHAVNGHVRAASGTVLTAAFVNFLTGTVALLVAFGVDVSANGWPAGSWPVQAWLYTGGAIGIGYIALAVAVVRFTGVLLLSLSMVTGQVTGGVLLDLAVPPPVGRPTAYTLLGAVLTVVAVFLAAGWRPVRPARRSAAPER